jgi:phosphoribosylformylglycinamidine synthase PurS subunit
MARVVVDVMLKPEILDPQGQAVQRALPRLGFDGIVDVRQGKRFELELDGPADEAALAKAREVAEKLLANTVIEEFTVAFDTESANTTSARADSAPADGGSASSAAVERTAD